MKVIATKRQEQGSSASRRLRRAGRVPGVVYGAGQPAQAIDVDHNALFHALRVEAFHSSLLDIEMGSGASEQVVLRNVQYHPYKKLVMHVDFLRVSADEKMSLSIPLHFVGQDDSPAVKLHQAIISHILTEVPVSCLPKDLPEYIEVDMSQLEPGSVIHASDLKLPDGVELDFGEDSDHVVAQVTIKVGGEEPAPAAAAAAPAAEAAKTDGKPAPGKG